MDDGNLVPFDGQDKDRFDWIVKNEGKQAALDELETMRMMARDPDVCWLSQYAYTSCEMLTGKSHYTSFYKWKEDMRDYILGPQLELSLKIKKEIWVDA